MCLSQPPSGQASRDALEARRRRRQSRRPVRDVQGHESRPDPLGSCTEAELMSAVRAYRLWAGNPSFRDMAAAAGNACSYRTLHSALSRDKLPAQAVIEAAIKGCGGEEQDVREFVTAWRQVKMGRETSRPRLAIASVS
jgi:hypothetical protein